MVTFTFSPPFCSMAALLFYQLPEYLRNDAVFCEPFLFRQQGKFAVQLLRDSNGQFLLCRHLLVTTFADIILRRHLAVNNTLANYFVLFYYQKGGGNMPSQLPKFTFRVDSVTLEKLRYIADGNFRTVNKELEMLVKKYISEYEQANGPIQLPKASD